ncbi:MAG: bifunctional adenosylcobinamide kinase/adenosylcobinamide-phosphate guanylyltransferase [Roseburia sp.]
MELYIGGYAQGKLAYVLREKKLAEEAVINGAEFVWKKEKGLSAEKQIFNDFERWVRKEIEREKTNQTDPVENQVKELIEENPGLLVISDEVGNGIVPLEPLEREYRERLGRILCFLAERADRMERILCGVGQRLK